MAKTEVVSWRGRNRNADAVATVVIIGASRGTGLETVKAALRAGTFGAFAGAVSRKDSY